MENKGQLKELKLFKYATTSVILGFLSGIFFVFAAIPSMIYAITALVEVRRYDRNKDAITIRRIAWFGLIIGLIGFVLSVYSILIIIKIFL